ncbi:hypothetical protein DZE36_21105 [Xanthomonas campestris pv. campestris]|nr:hypothetical protein DFG55_13835 [Xanthomonas campestris pv. campestris]QCX72154.1 hypothetical protein DFG54_16590 [Xanthomonas campestris pv. campestris]RFF41440.1 hypothetical protein D0A42_17065 [Xanthomonas campestris pv. campestris]RFF72152.1 hypothetical protein DZE36_21105 [Xanthomonas campestris pv. campestris]
MPALLLPWLCTFMFSPLVALLLPHRTGCGAGQHVLPACLCGVALNRGDEPVVIGWMDCLAACRIRTTAGTAMNLEGVVEILHTVEIGLIKPAVRIAIPLYAAPPCIDCRLTWA